MSIKSERSSVSTAPQALITPMKFSRAPSQSGRAQSSTDPTNPFFIVLFAGDSQEQTGKC